MNPDFVFDPPNVTVEHAAYLDEREAEGWDDSDLEVTISADTSAYLRSMRDINKLLSGRRRTHSGSMDFRPKYENSDDAAMKDLESRKRARKS